MIKICNTIGEINDCIVKYTDHVTSPIDEKNLCSDWIEENLFSEGFSHPQGTTRYCGYIGRKVVEMVYNGHTILVKMWKDDGIESLADAYARAIEDVFGEDVNKTHIAIINATQMKRDKTILILHYFLKEEYTE